MSKSPHASVLQLNSSRPSLLELNSSFGEAKDVVSRIRYIWPRSGRYKEFAGFITDPQQDVSKVKQATKIHPETDQRAQPLWQLVCTNVHHHKVTALPPKTATVKEVREFVYFVLGSDRFSDIAATSRSCAIGATITFCDLDGQGLRRFCLEGTMSICPYSWLNVYNEVVYSTNSERADIDYHLGRAINPLILAERAAEGKALKKKERAERRALDRKFRQDNFEYLRIKLTSLFCFGEEKRSDTPPPAYVEKMDASEIWI